MQLPIVEPNAVVILELNVGWEYQICLCHYLGNEEL